MYSAPCLTGVFSICFFLFVTIWVTSLGSILRSCELRRNFSFTPCFRGPQMVRYASAFRLLPAQVHSSGVITARGLEATGGGSGFGPESPDRLERDGARLNVDSDT